MDLTERRTVPLADVLTVTTGLLLSRTRMDGLCALVQWLQREPPVSARMYEPDIRRLLAAARAARRRLTGQHPFLANLTPQPSLDEADLYAWLLEAERVHGETLTVSRPPLPATVAAMDQFTASARDNFNRMRANVAEWVAGFEAAKRALDAFAAALSTTNGQPGRRRHQLRAHGRARRANLVP